MQYPSDQSPQDAPGKAHANRHVRSFLQLPALDENDTNTPVQLLRDGRFLNAQRLLRDKDLTLTRPILVHDTPRSIGMKVLEFPRGRQVTIRDIADILGHHYPVNVIDVEHQEEREGWTLEDLVEYFEDEERLLLQHRQELLAAQENNQSGSQRRRRKAAEASITKQNSQRPRVLNQISLEFSKTALSDQIFSPRFVREIDWIDNAWPRPRNEDGTLSRPFDEVYPNVQYYCLTSAAGCYTDFHLDFGGTSVWYHILSGEKIFCLIPPTKENLAIYEQWLCSPDQSSTFLPDLIPNPEENVLRISLKATQTLIIPTAWIHAVYTPSDSIVIGGNFLHGMDIPLQLEVHCIEARARVQEKFRFPFFLPLNFYAGGYYLKKMRAGKISKREVDGLGDLINALDEWWKVHSQGSSHLHSGPTVRSAAEECAKKNGCESVGVFLSKLREEHKRTVEKGISPSPEAPPALVSSLPTSPAVLVSRPKIRLSLKGKKSTPVVSDPVVSDSAKTVEKKELKSSSSKFRIVVSSSKWHAAAPKISKRRREDSEWIDTGVPLQEEWVPGSSKTKRRSSSGSNGDPRLSTGFGTAPAPRRQPKPSTARQRLKKRFR